MAPQLCACALHQLWSMAVMPLRAAVRADHWAKESPPANVGTRKVTLRTVQLAAADAVYSSPSASTLSSVRATMVAKSWWYVEPSTPPQVPKQAICAFLHSTGSRAHAATSYATPWIERPASL